MVLVGRHCTYKVCLGGPKIEIFNFELEIKLDHHFYVEFHGESNGDGLEAQKPSLGPQNGHKGPKNRNFLTLSYLKSKIAPRVEAFKCSYFYRSLETWNSIPFDIRSIEDPAAFKSSMKAHLWTIAENWPT